METGSEKMGVGGWGLTVDSEPCFEGQSRSILRVRSDQGVEVLDVWVQYVGLGGTLFELDIEAFLFGLMPLPNLEHMLLMQALQELLVDCQ